MTIGDAGLVDGQPLPDGEVWFRELTNTDFVKKDGTIHRQALKAPAISPSVGRAWSHELSGRALSNVADPEGDALNSVDRIRDGFRRRGQIVPSKIVFAGVAYALAQDLRTTPPLPTDAVFSPINGGDQAHSDFVIYDAANDAQADAARTVLQRTLNICAPANLAQTLAHLRRAGPSP